MNIKENMKIKNQTHAEYDQFELDQFILEFENQLEKIIIQAFDDTGNVVFTKEFNPKFINAHLNVLWQDKGEKKPDPILSI